MELKAPVSRLHQHHCRRGRGKGQGRRTTSLEDRQAPASQTGSGTLVAADCAECQRRLVRKGSGARTRAPPAARPQPAPAVRAIDTTAAGDAFCGALADVLAEGGSLTDAIAWGVMVGAATTLRHGAQTSLPTAAEVADLLELP